MPTKCISAPSKVWCMMLLLQDLEASLAASMSREKETMEQTATLEKEKENLARELASYINKDQDKVDNVLI